MKGVKTSTSLQVGDIITVKSNGTVFSYSGEDGNSDPDTAYQGELLGVVQKISGSLIVFKNSSGIVRNSVSTGSMNFAANPDYDYQAVTTTTTGNDNRNILEKGLDFGLKIFDTLFGKTTTTNSASNNNNDSGTDSGTTGNNDNNGNDDNKEEKTFFQKYGIYGIVIAVLGIVLWVILGGKKQQVVYQQAPQQTPYQPPVQYQTNRL